MFVRDTSLFLDLVSSSLEIVRQESCTSAQFMSVPCLSSSLFSLLSQDARNICRQLNVFFLFTSVFSVVVERKRRMLCS